MSTLTDFSNFNIANSVALYLAEVLLTGNYLVYWADRDVVQTPDGWYAGYRQNHVTYLADATFGARATAAVGMMTLVSAYPTEPRFIARPTGDGSPLGQDEVAVPTMSVDIGPPIVGPYAEVGSRERWRYRQLSIEAFVRTAQEQKRLEEVLEQSLVEDEPLTIQDHDAGTLATVDTVSPQRVTIVRGVEIHEADSRAFQVLANALLEYRA